ncbi:TPA: DUF2913 family protein [Klebsiella pneumoniae]|uniref:DUF2913 family protein n=1 Tax=Klebsiella pneumoniae TaxID=573 RepID=UPI00265C3593|nr:DUF2913 family protein [Klebsiella pneumoniae]MDO0653647.1 DUF2913 family protein [Klebsiella pneumoniae]MDO0817052.1 DUF2913 family protein [Klebsiella pneumoniae]HDG8190638.1 DUF2913 family protein [Klebsiella pneumoniae]HEN5063936.1 DUF2913 family protein [Klebsiella pneumoniae]HEN5361435.1 DUF2913 family protein [Klebsiella pneumoniae]
MNNECSSGGIGHLAWCALVALGLQKSEQRVVSETEENLFLIRWLATARRQKRFSPDLSGHIDWLLSQGRRLGPRARLTQKLQYLWLLSNGELSDMPDILRLTYAIEVIKAGGWQYWVVDEKKWLTGTFNNHINSVCFIRTEIEQGFDNNGKQICPLRVKAKGHLVKLMSLLECFGWCVQEADTPVNDPDPRNSKGYLLLSPGAHPAV